jgi:hypothetical protein
MKGNHWDRNKGYLTDHIKAIGDEMGTTEIMLKNFIK